MDASKRNGSRLVQSLRAYAQDARVWSLEETMNRFAPWVALTGCLFVACSNRPTPAADSPAAHHAHPTRLARHAVATATTGLGAVCRQTRSPCRPAHLRSARA